MNANIRKVGHSKDETGYTILYFLNGYIYIMETGGFRGGYDDGNLERLAKVAKKWKINDCLVEGNFGDGMWLKIFEPILAKHHKCALIETKSKGQKEVRIADVLEPVMGAHKLVATEYAVTNDYQTARNADGVHDVKYSMFYQLSRLTRDRGSLKNDDRLDSLAIGVSYFLECMCKDSDAGLVEATEEFIMSHMEDLRKGWDDVVIIAGAGDINIRYEENDDDLCGSFMNW